MFFLCRQVLAASSAMSSSSEMMVVSVALMSGRLILDSAQVTPGSTIDSLRAEAESVLGQRIKSLIVGSDSTADSKATLQQLGVKSGDQLLALVSPLTWDPEHGTTGKLTEDNTVLTACNNYRPVIASCGFSSGFSRWRVQGTGWDRAVTGVALGSVVESAEWLGKLDDAWAFTSQERQGHWRVVPDMKDGDWLSFVLDSDKGTLRIWHNDRELVELQVEGLRGKELYPVGGCNKGDSSLRLVQGGIDSGGPAV